MLKNKKPNKIDQLSNWFTHAIGTNTSIAIHTLLFIGIFVLTFLGVSTEEVLLILTTAVSLEAIYLAIFIQMSVNKTTESLAGVEEDIDDIQEDVDSLEENIKDISDDYIDDVIEENDTIKILTTIESQLNALKLEVAELKKKNLS